MKDIAKIITIKVPIREIIALRIVSCITLVSSLLFLYCIYDEAKNAKGKVKSKIDISLNNRTCSAINGAEYSMKVRTQRKPKIGSIDHILARFAGNFQFMIAISISIITKDIDNNMIPNNSFVILELPGTA